MFKSPTSHYSLNELQYVPPYSACKGGLLKTPRVTLQTVHLNFEKLALSSLCGELLRPIPYRGRNFLARVTGQLTPTTWRLGSKLMSDETR